MTITIDILDIIVSGTAKTAVIEITNDTPEVQSYIYRRGGIPMGASLAQIQTGLDAEADKLWQGASAKGATNIWQAVNDRQLMRAGMLVLLDEINRMRVASLLNPYTEKQFLGAVKTKLLDN